MTKVLITGSAGFIGSQLAYRLSKNGYDLVLVDDFSYGKEDNLIFEDADFRDTVRKIDITDFDVLKDLFEKERFDYVYHIAGIAPLPDCQSNPTRAIEVNVVGTVNILELSRRYGVKNVIFASTSAIYENAESFPCEESEASKPTLIYPCTKYSAEQFCRSYHSTYGLNISIMRFANVYGPHIDCLRKQPPFVAYVIRELYYDRIPTFYSNGEQRRDYIYIDDLLDIACILMTNTGFDVVNVSSCTTISVNEIYALISKIMKKDIVPNYLEPEKYWSKYPSLYEGAYSISKSILDAEVNKYTLCSNQHALEKYGWHPKINMEEGLRRTISYAEKLFGRDA